MRARDQEAYIDKLTSSGRLPAEIRSPKDFIERTLEDLFFVCAFVLRRGKKVEYRFHMVSTHQALGEGTGIPAAMGAILMQRGQVQGKGILPPEACINPVEFLPFAVQMFAKDAASKGKTAEGFIIERVDEQGKGTRISM